MEISENIFGFKAWFFPSGRFFGLEEGINKTVSIYKDTV